MLPLLFLIVIDCYHITSITLEAVSVFYLLFHYGEQTELGHCVCAMQQLHPHLEFQSAGTGAIKQNRVIYGQIVHYGDFKRLNK